MSTCISMHGEFGSHELTGERADRFVCRRCGVLDEDGMMDALDAAEARLTETCVEHGEPSVSGFCQKCWTEDEG